MSSSFRFSVCLAAALAASFLFASPARTQTAAQNWSVSANAQRWLATSPAQTGGQRVRVFFYPAVRTTENIDAWMTRESLTRVRQLGRIVWTNNSYVRDTNLVGLSRTITDANNVRTGVFAWAYETQQGRQLVIVTLPIALGESNAAYQQAQTTWTDAWLGARPYQPGRTPPPAVQATTPAPQQQPPTATGQNCRREPIWGFRISVWCQPSGVCPDREIKGYETVCD